MPSPQFPEVVSSSLRADWNLCHRKFFYSQILGLSPRGANVHFVFGNAYANGLEYFRKAYYDHYKSSPKRFELSAACGLEALIHSYGNYDPGDDAVKSFDRCVGAYVEYLHRFHPERDYIQTSIGPTGRPRVEFSFAYTTDVAHPVTGNPIIFSGRFDQLAEYNSMLFVYDDKTTQQLGASWSTQWDLRSQFTGYCFGAREHDLQVAGAIIRGMGVYKTKFDTVDAIVHRPPFMVARWRERLTWDLHRMVQAWNEGYWPHTGEENGGCSHYGKCAYVDLCQAERPENFYPLFEERRYMPLEREGDRDRRFALKSLPSTSSE